MAFMIRTSSWLSLYGKNESIVNNYLLIIDKHRVAETIVKYLSVDTFLAELRLQIYRRWIATGRSPTVDELCAAMQQDVVPGLDELAEAHTIVLEPVTKPGMRIIRMAHPFSGVPTAYRVRSGGISYWANCAWDCLGIAALLDAIPRRSLDARIAGIGSTFRCTAAKCATVHGPAGG